MNNEWKTYKVSVKNLDLLLSARSEAQAQEIVRDSIRKGQLADRLRLSEESLQLKVTLARGLQA
jgi:hypothetical protein